MTACYHHRVDRSIPLEAERRPLLFLLEMRLCSVQEQSGPFPLLVGGMFGTPSLLLLAFFALLWPLPVSCGQLLFPFAGYRYTPEYISSK